MNEYERINAELELLKNKIESIEEKIDTSQNHYRVHFRSIQKQISKLESGSIMLFWGGVITIIICAIFFF
ncbi:ELKS/Rab6-interacting/CAST family protein [Candidatus Thioglobus sp.]|nr:ELKS/Rab6-interacting/CAST family protein [Candidatus Thioglobus sp.]